MSKPVVAIVNDEPTFRYVVSQLFTSAGFHPVVVSHDEAATAVVDALPAAVVIDTTWEQGLVGTLLVERLRRDEATRYAPIVVCSPDDDFHRAYGDYLRGRDCRLVGKPFDFGAVLAALQPPIAPAASESLPTAPSQSSV